jgi:hypothetical protein
VAYVYVVMHAGETAAAAVADPINQGKSDRAIAEEIGASQPTVSAARNFLTDKNLSVRKGGPRLSVIVDLEKLASVASGDAAAKAAGVSPSSVEAAKALLKGGTPEEIEAYRSGKIALQAAANIVRARQPRATKKKRRDKRVATLLQFPKVQPPLTREETGHPPEGADSREVDAFYARYGRTPLRPQVITHCMESLHRVNALAGTVKLIVSPTHPDVERFFADIDVLLAYVPQPEKGPRYDTDYAAKARRALRDLREALPKVQTLVAALESKLADYPAPASRNNEASQEGVSASH